MNNFKLYEHILLKAERGVETQVNKAIEELSELICELARLKTNRGDYYNLVDEMIDVEIMLEQLKSIFTNKDFFEERKKETIKKIAERFDYKGDLT